MLNLDATNVNVFYTQEISPAIEFHRPKLSVHLMRNYAALLHTG